MSRTKSKTAKTTKTKKTTKTRRHRHEFEWVSHWDFRDGEYWQCVGCGYIKFPR